MTQDAVVPTDAPPPEDTPAINAPTRDALEAKTKAELAADYDVSEALSKAEMIDAVLTQFGIVMPRAGFVVLAVNPVTSSEHHWKAGEAPITPQGTPVPADQVEDIIRIAAAGGVKIYEVI